MNLKLLKLKQMNMNLTYQCWDRGSHLEKLIDNSTSDGSRRLIDCILSNLNIVEQVCTNILQNETYCHTEVRCCEKKPKNTTQKERTDVLLLILTSWVFMLIGLHASNKLKSKLLVQRVRVWGRFRITLPFYTLFRGVRHNWDVL